MNKADKAMWMDMEFYENEEIAEGRKHKKMQGDFFSREDSKEQ